MAGMVRKFHVMYDGSRSTRKRERKKMIDQRSDLTLRRYTATEVRIPVTAMVVDMKKYIFVSRSLYPLLCMSSMRLNMAGTAK